MMTKREQEIFDAVLEILRTQLSPTRVILFGSRAKETASLSSDFDFAVQCAKPDAAQKRHVKEAIEKVSGLYGVDVVYWDELDEKFQDIILKTGKVVYLADPPARKEPREAP